jgi:isocitrate dehydrogenase
MAEKISMGNDGKLNVPDKPTIPFIEGDGRGFQVKHFNLLVILNFLLCFI